MKAPVLKDYTDPPEDLTNWQNAIVYKRSAIWNDYFGYHGPRRRVSSKNFPEGSRFFHRKSKRRHRTRYVVCETDEFGSVFITNAEIRYRKSKKAWGVFINDEPVRHYRTLKACKSALLPGVLDRMSAEVDRCLDLPCSVPSLKSEA